MPDPGKSFLDSRDAKPVDDAPLKSYITAMIDDVIPDILADVRVREQLAAELRYSRTASIRDDKAKAKA